MDLRTRTDADVPIVEAERFFGVDLPEMAARRANAVYLPDVSFPPGVVPVSSLERAVQDVSLVLSAVPSVRVIR